MRDYLHNKTPVAVAAADGDDVHHDDNTRFALNKKIVKIVSLGQLASRVPTRDDIPGKR